MRSVALCLLLLPASLEAGEPAAPAPKPDTLTERLFVPGARVGFVDIVGEVGPDGRVIEAKVVRSEPSGKFDKEALRIVRGYRYRPKLIDGVAVARRFEQRIVFGDDAQPVNAPPDFAQPVEPVDAEHDLVPLVRKPPTLSQRELVSGVSGWVRLVGVVDVQGNVKSARVAASRPAGVFDETSLRAIRQWRFKPYMKDGVAVEREFTQLFQFNLSYSGRKEADPLLELLTADPEAGERLYGELRQLCPDRFPRADDSVNEALRQANALPPLADKLGSVADWAKVQIEQIEPCLFSSWEQLRDPKAFEVAARLVALGTPARLAQDSANALRAYGAQLAGTPGEPLTVEQRLQVRAWLFLRMAPAYRALLEAQTLYMAAPVAADPAAIALLDQANAALRERGGREARSVLLKGMKRIPQAKDRLLPLMMLARVESALSDPDAAREALDGVLAVSDAPWNVTIASHIARASLCGRIRDAACFDESMGVVVRELGVEDRLSF